MKTVKKNVVIPIYPAKAEKNDKGEKLANIDKIESNIGIYRFIYNKELEFINYFRSLLIRYGYKDQVIVNDTSCSVILDMLMQEYPFLEKAESSSRQQSQRNLIKAFKRYYDSSLKSNCPVLKTKKNQKDTFRIMKNNNNLRIQKDKYGYDKIRLPKLGLVKFKTSKKYHELLRKGSNPDDPTVEIKHVTIKKVNGEYYAVFNIIELYVPWGIIGARQQLGIDIGCSKLAALSNGQEIPNLDLTREVNKIIQYQQKMSHTKPGSIRHNKAQRLYNLWTKKLINRRNDYYDKVTSYIVKNSSFVAVQNENIISWKHNKYLSRKLQLNAPRIFMDKLEYKCIWNDVEFIKVPRNFPSTQICSKCGKRNHNMSGLRNLGTREWDCPQCKTHHDRDINASKNILNKGLEIVGTTVQ
jgi:putative transposase